MWMIHVCVIDPLSVGNFVFHFDNNLLSFSLAHSLWVLNWVKWLETIVDDTVMATSSIK